jgi:hypothetical protein
VSTEGSLAARSCCGRFLSSPTGAPGWVAGLAAQIGDTCHQWRYHRLGPGRSCGVSWSPPGDVGCRPGSHLVICVTSATIDGLGRWGALLPLAGSEGMWSSARFAEVRHAEYAASRVDCPRTPSEHLAKMRAASGPAGQSPCSGAFALDAKGGRP